MSIHEVNNNYDEVWPMNNPIGGRKSHDGLALTARMRMQNAAKGVAMTLSAIGVSAAIIAGAIFSLAVDILGHTATAHEAAISFTVETNDMEQAGVYYVVTDPDGIVVTQGPASEGGNTVSLSDLEENTTYTLSLYDKDGNFLQSHLFTTADDPDPIPEILTLIADYDRLTNTVSITGTVRTNDALDFTAALSSGDFVINPDNVSVSPETDGVVQISYSGEHTLERGEYSAALTVGYTEEAEAKEKSKSASFKVADLVINGFSGRVGLDKRISLDAIATHYYTDVEPYNVENVIISAKQVYTGQTFDVPANFLVNGDSISINAMTGVLDPGNYRFWVDLTYTINGVASPELSVSAGPIDVFVAYDTPVTTPKPAVTPTPTPVVTPTPAPAYTDLVIDSASLHVVNGLISVNGAVVPNDAQNVTGTISVPALNATAALILEENTDGSLNLRGEIEQANPIPPGTYTATITLNYTLGGEAKSKSMDLTHTVESWLVDYFYAEYNDNAWANMGLALSLAATYQDPAVEATVTRIEYISSANQSYISYNTEMPSPNYLAAWDTTTDILPSTGDTMRAIIYYTVGTSTEELSCNVPAVPIKFFDTASPTTAPDPQISQVQSGTAYTATFQFEGSGAAELSITGLTLTDSLGNTVDQSAYSITNNLTGITGSYSVTGPFTGGVTATLSYTYRLIGQTSYETRYKEITVNPAEYLPIELTITSAVESAEPYALSLSGTLRTETPGINQDTIHLIGSIYFVNVDGNPQLYNSTFPIYSPTDGTFSGTIPLDDLPDVTEYTVEVYVSAYTYSGVEISNEITQTVEHTVTPTTP